MWFPNPGVTRFVTGTRIHSTFNSAEEEVIEELRLSVDELFSMSKLFENISFFLCFFPPHTARI